MRGVHAVGGNQAAAFVIENIQRTQKEISTGDLIPPPPLRGVCDCNLNIF